MRTQRKTVQGFALFQEKQETHIRYIHFSTRIGKGVYQRTFYQHFIDFKLSPEQHPHPKQLHLNHVLQQTNKPDGASVFFVFFPMRCESTVTVNQNADADI